MKRFTLPLMIILIGLSVVLVFSNFVTYQGGSPAGYSGSPADAMDCSDCHGGSATSATGILSSDIPVAGYTAGANYTITVTLAGSGKKGFEVSPQNSAGTLLGTLTAGSGTTLKGSGKYITQSSAVTTSPAVWTFTWTAPASGTGTVTFYGAFAITTSTTKVSTMVVNESSASVSDNNNPSTSFVTFPNPVTNQININYFVKEAGYVSLQLFDLNGRLIKDILSENNSSTGNKNTVFYAGNNLKSGVYFLRFTNENIIETRKIIVN